jgi:hypothetical protein
MYIIIVTRYVSINLKRNVARASETTLRAFHDVSATSRRLFADTGNLVARFHAASSPASRTGNKGEIERDSS